DGQIEVEVRDNGVGFDVARSSSAGERIASFGLRSIDERLRVLGGELQVSSAPGQGSRIALAAPAVMTGVQQDTKPDP
ncbi:MAG: ATP-binding protein, partial [Halofilum sp. (in: g-proteobacteria)]